MKIFLVLLSLLGVPALAGAQGAPREPVTSDCVMKVVEHYRVPLALVLGIMATEGGKVGEVSHNANGSYDIGPMQINSSWLPKLRSLGISEETILLNGCSNVAVAGWLLHDLLQKYPPWLAVGHYHSPTPARNVRYQWLVWNRLKRLDPKRVIARANGQ